MARAVEEPISRRMVEVRRDPHRHPEPSRLEERSAARAGVREAAW